jgi:hypothetical protein
MGHHAMKPNLDLAHDQMLAAVHGIIRGLGLNDSVPVPPFGMGIRISKALNDAHEHPGELFHADHYELIDKAFSRFGGGRPSNRIDECATAFFNVLYRPSLRTYCYPT